MNIEETRHYLQAALAVGIRPGLARMTGLLALLQHPEKDLTCIHIAGTNGKGSVSAFCSAILAAGGYRVGIYTSPALERQSERIRIIDGATGLQALAGDETHGEISPDDLAAVISAVKVAADAWTLTSGDPPSEFELFTAAAFCHFARQHCDWVVLETGLGGRLDATNVIAQPYCSIITALGYDHQAFLGSTITAIAHEKAGIIKAGRPVYLYDPAAALDDPADAAAVRAVIETHCAELDAPLTIIGPDLIHLLQYDWTGQLFQIGHDRDAVYTTQLLGIFQPVNAALAFAACRTLVPARALASGIAAVRWPARLERCSQAPPVLLDGAHNPQGCQALAAALDRLLPDQPVIFLIGLLRDKDYPAMLAAVLQPHRYRPWRVICVSPDNPRALPARELAAAVQAAWPGAADAGLAAAHLKQTAPTDLKNPGPGPGGELINPPACGYNSLGTILVADSPLAGAVLALQLAEDTRTAICAFGSLYMVGDIRPCLLRREVHRLWTGSKS